MKNQAKGLRLDGRPTSRRSFLRAALAAGAGGWAAVGCSSPRKAIRMWTINYFNRNIMEHFFEEARRAGERIGYTVEVEAIAGEFQEYTSKIAAAADAGTLPDIFTPLIAMRQFIRDGRLLPIPDVWEKVGGDAGGWHPIAESNFSLDGVGHALTDGLIPAYMHIRRDLVEAAGFSLPFKDMDEMEACAKAITRPDDNVHGCGFGMSRNDDLHHLLPYMWAYGGALQDARGTITLDSPQNAQGLRRLTDLYRVHKVVPQGAVNWDAFGNNQSYLSGQGAMVINAGSLLAAVRRRESPVEDLLEQTYVGPVPQALPEIGPQCLTQPGMGFGINADTKHPEAAKEVLLHLWSPEVYTKLMRMSQSYFFPALMDIYDDEYFSEDPWNRQVVEGVMPFVHDESWAGPPRPWTMMWATWGGQAIRRVIEDDWEPQRAMAEAQQTVEAARDAYQRA